MPRILSYVVTEPFLFLTPPQVIAASLLIENKKNSKM